MPKVLNFGSLNIDYVYSVEHFVKPKETLQSLGLEIFSGGKGLNQSMALTKGDCDTYHAGCVGIDDGKFLTDILNNAGANTTFVKAIETRTGNAIIQVDKSGQNCILLYGGANQKIDEKHIDNVVSNFSSDDYIILQNEINNTDIIMRKAHEKGMKIVFNPAPYDESINKLPLDLVSYLIVNEIEGADIAGIESEDGNVIMQALNKKFSKTKTVLTLGKQGVIYFDGEKQYSHGVYNVPVVDTTAAGDTFIGFFVSCLIKGYSAEKTLEIASKASSIAVSRKGAAVSIPLFEEALNAKMELE